MQQFFLWNIKKVYNISIKTQTVKSLSENFLISIKISWLFWTKEIFWFSQVLQEIETPKTIINTIFFGIQSQLPEVISKNRSKISSYALGFTPERNGRMFRF